MVAKDADDIQGLVRANRAVARLLRELAALARPGVTTAALDRHAREFMAKLDAEPVFHTEAGFPAAINTSINDAVLHGVPGEDVLRSGDVLGIDAGMLLDGYCGDSALTMTIGEASPRTRRLLRVARETTRAGIAVAIAGNHVGDIGHAMQGHAAAHGYDVMRDFTGHGVGRRMHEWPSVPFFGEPGDGPTLMDGMVITIEPAIVEGSPDWRLDPDGWTVRTVDGGWSAQFEHTVIVGKRAARVLTAA